MRKASNSKQYKVVGKVAPDGVPHLEVIATYNSEMPALVSKTSYLKEAYRVLVFGYIINSSAIASKLNDFIYLLAVANKL